MKKLTAILDYGEVDDLLELLDREIIKYRADAKFKYLCKEISKAQYEWSQGYAGYLEKLRDKIKIEDA